MPAHGNTTNDQNKAADEAARTARTVTDEAAARYVHLEGTSSGTTPPWTCARPPTTSRARTPCSGRGAGSPRLSPAGRRARPASPP